MSWGLAFQVGKDPRGVTVSLSPGSFGHGDAYGTQSWADPKRDLIFILMNQRAGLPLRLVWCFGFVRRERQ